MTSATALPAGELRHDQGRAEASASAARSSSRRRSTPALIGGAVIDAGDVVIDGSVRGKLERLQAALADRRRAGCSPHSNRTVGGSTPALQETTMATTTLNPSEISELIKSRIEKVKLAAEARNEGTVISRVRRHRAHPRPGRRDAGRNARVAGQHLRPGAEPRARLGRRGDAGRLRAHLAKATPSRPPAASSKCRSAPSCSAAWSTRSASRSTARARSTPS